MNSLAGAFRRGCATTCSPAPARFLACSLAALPPPMWDSDRDALQGGHPFAGEDSDELQADVDFDDVFNAYAFNFNAFNALPAPEQMEVLNTLRAQPQPKEAPLMLLPPEAPVSSATVSETHAGHGHRFEQPSGGGTIPPTALLPQVAPSTLPKRAPVKGTDFEEIKTMPSLVHLVRVTQIVNLPVKRCAAQLLAGGPLATIDEAAKLLVPLYDGGDPPEGVSMVGKPLKLEEPALSFYDAKTTNQNPTGILTPRVPGPKSGTLYPVCDRPDLGIVKKVCTVPGDCECAMYVLVQVLHAADPKAGDNSIIQLGECTFLPSSRA